MVSAVNFHIQILLILDQMEAIDAVETLNIKQRTLLNILKV